MSAQLLQGGTFTLGRSHQTSMRLNSRVKLNNTVHLNLLIKWSFRFSFEIKCNSNKLEYIPNKVEQ